MQRVPRDLTRLIVTDWVAYTPTFTSFGSVTNVSFFSRRIGDSLEVRGKFTTGTPAASEARITLGFNGVNGGLTSNSTKLASGTNYAGHFLFGTNAVQTGYVLIEPSVDYLTFSIQWSGGNGITKANASTFTVSGGSYAIFAQVPLTEFS